MDAVGKTEIRPLDSSHLEEAAVLLGKLNPDTPVHLVHERLASILAEHPHYQIIGAFDGSRLVGVCGAWVATKIWCGRYLEIDNLVVDPDCRSGGVGTQLMLYLEETARKKTATCSCWTVIPTTTRRIGFTTASDSKSGGFISSNPSVTGPERTVHDACHRPLSPRSGWRFRSHHPHLAHP
jgi:GNAT superfamily N-acetyltransferase